MSDAAISILREFNRTFTPRIGVLDETFLGTGRPLAVARLLFEVGLGDVTVHELRRRLGADSGYVSRLLRRLEDDGLIDVAEDPADGRRRIASLTDAGRAEWLELDRRSDATARRLLNPLSDDQCQELASALVTAQRLLQLSTITFETVEPDSASASTALQAYFTELDDRFVDGFDPVESGADNVDDMRAPAGAFVTVVDGGVVVGCAGLRTLADGRAEIKRMWLDPSLRGLGVGKRLLIHLESLARERGHDAIVLDTNSTLHAAIAMYLGAGYESIECYNDNPDAQRWFRKQL